MALQQTPQQAFRQFWTVGQQRSDSPTAAVSLQGAGQEKVAPSH
jgi:hypothetical protein